ncbi:hypothetical protein AB0T83_13790 [Fluviibacterium sp. DFM31]|uniref:Uncharacterized protein n=1 Tax=Meridianimarinicoccus marinus TaxID=3231483 RepID=A0ABV3LBP6_9RHOB
MESAKKAGKLTPEEMVVPRVFNNPMSASECQALIPDLDLATYFEVIGFPMPARLIIAEMR